MAVMIMKEGKVVKSIPLNPSKCPIGHIWSESLKEDDLIDVVLELQGEIQKMKKQMNREEIQLNRAKDLIDLGKRNKEVSTMFADDAICQKEFIRAESMIVKGLNTQLAAQIMIDEIYAKLTRLQDLKKMFEEQDKNGDDLAESQQSVDSSAKVEIEMRSINTLVIHRPIENMDKLDESTKSQKTTHEAQILVAGATKDPTQVKGAPTAEPEVIRTKPFRESSCSAQYNEPSSQQMNGLFWNVMKFGRYIFTSCSRKKKYF